MTSTDGHHSFWETVIGWLLSLLGVSPKEEPPKPVRKKWTFMVYMAGDNNLNEAGRKDLSEMQAAGSTADVNIIAQFDGLGDEGSRRYYIRQGGTPDRDVVVRLPEVNMGDPQALDDFLRWAQENYPAEHYALILWNHGNGWKDEDIYRSLAVRGFRPQSLTRGQRRSLTSGNSSRAFFRSSIEHVAVNAVLEQRAILFDDTSADFLDNVEMKAVLDRGAARLGQKIDLLGCDACLMNMLEVAYQLKSSCRYLVGSQEEEPGDGWPYDRILSELIANPDMSADLLAAITVQEYNRFYRDRYPNLPVTQSALDLERVDPLADAVDGLADTLRATLEADPRGGNSIVSLALYDVQKFADRDYVDLVHFCQLLAEQNPGTAVAAAAARVVNLVKRGGDSSPLVAEGHGGPGMRHANGLSIYLPERTLSPLYGRLEFAEDHRWDEFLQARLALHLRASAKPPSAPHAATLQE